jgi:hypothetical protein
MGAWFAGAGAAGEAQGVGCDAGQLGVSGDRCRVCSLFLESPKPAYVSNYWVIYCAVALMSAIGMWYVPYVRGAREEEKEEYLRMYAGTRQILPARGDNPRPNLFHVGIHVLFVVNFCLALGLRFYRP